jgi:alpha-tubulin suppressor-like RCC1 family protein
MLRDVTSVALVAVACAGLAACDLISGVEDPISPVREAALATGTLHACALDADGVAYCWGGNASGQLGTGDTNPRSAPTPVAGDHRFVAITAGGSTTCALTAGGAAYCWGLNGHGQLGDGGSANQSRPQPVTGNVAFQEIHAGYRFVCARAADGTAYCWGANDWSQIGRRVSDPVTAPSQVSGTHTFVSLSAGLVQACGLTAAGEAYCWGAGAYGALGNGSEENQAQPTPVAGGRRFSHLKTGASTTCGVTTDGATYCWGLDHHGSLGVGTPYGSAYRPTPVRIEGDPGLVAVNPGADNSVFAPACGITAGGVAYCWGSNAYGVLGSSSATQQCGPVTSGEPFTCSGVPLRVDGGLRFAVIRPAGEFVCGITTDRQIYCWGNNHVGQLGSPAATERCRPGAEERPCSTQPIPVAGNFRSP